MSMVTRSLVNYPDLGDRVYQVLKDEILASRLTPGTKLVIRELASRMGVSGTPVQDALERLSAEGLVQDVPRRGYFVSKLDARDIAELQQARLILETAAVEHGFGSIEPAFIARMRSVVENLERLMEPGEDDFDYAAFLGQDTEFHFLVMETLGNSRLIQVYRSLYLQLNASRIHLGAKLGYRAARETLVHQKEALTAFESRDLAAAKAALAAHIHNGTRHLAAGEHGEASHTPARSTTERKVSMHDTG